MFKIHFGRVQAVVAFALFFLLLQVSAPRAESTAAQGQEIYNTYCSQCHGANLKNTGSNAPDLRKFPLNQKARFFKSVTVGKGQGKMPAWGDILSQEQIGMIWSFVKKRGKI